MYRCKINWHRPKVQVNALGDYLDKTVLALQRNNIARYTPAVYKSARGYILKKTIKNNHNKKILTFSKFSIVHVNEIFVIRSLLVILKDRQIIIFLIIMNG